LVFNSGNLNTGGDVPTITIQNRSGVNFNAIYVRPSIATDWGINFGSLNNNNNNNIKIPIHPSNYTNFSIQLRGGGGSIPAYTYTRNNINISNGMIITILSTDSDISLSGPPVFVIQNNTTTTISHAWVKPSSSTDWGSPVFSWVNLANGVSYTATIPQAIVGYGSYDVLLSTSSSTTSGSRFIRSWVSIANGTILTFTVSDMN